MSSIIKLEFEKELDSLKIELSEINNGIETSTRLSNNNTALIKEAISRANSTTSIDEKINLLANGLQEVVARSEEYCSTLKEDVHRLRDKIEYISQFLSKIDHLVEEEKKSNPIIEEPEIQIPAKDRRTPDIDS
jgi:uncharacterized phage infection (PIP) family protein YhgE